MNDTRRAVLDALAEGPVSGPELADRLGVSRAAVWKHVDALRDAGFDVESTDAGYVVAEVPDYGAAAVEFGLDAPYRVEHHDSVASTNDRARDLAADGASDVVVVADEQTGGRGRLKRAWSSPSGGVWASLVLRPDRPPAHVPVFTLAAAVAVARACREAGAPAVIKWPNDVLVDGSERKLAGVLTEMEGEADRVSWLVVGAGVNANVDADALPPGATSVREEAGDVDRRRFLQRTLETFHELWEDPDRILPAWRELSVTLDRRVRVETATEVLEGEAVDVTFPGALVVRTADGRRTIHAGECEHLRPA
ncbi:biotin--[acetyl-CoA-carboxylase] ligase [Salinirarus marinus]|uniref:biotin--[acetyl-CoA-carboxylase] ligase n=1 Tax=Salinirarus marinus TaxID=3068310 RepID=UPI003C6C878F